MLSVLLNKTFALFEGCEDRGDEASCFPELPARGDQHVGGEEPRHGHQRQPGAAGRNHSFLLVSQWV